MPRNPQMRKPVGVGGNTFLDVLPLQAVPAQFRSHAKRSLAPGSMKTDKIFHIAPIVEQFLGAQGIEQERDDHSIVTLLN